jgi:hypothetical protein
MQYRSHQKLSVTGCSASRRRLGARRQNDCTGSDDGNVALIAMLVYAIVSQTSLQPSRAMMSAASGNVLLGYRGHRGLQGG